MTLPKVLIATSLALATTAAAALGATSSGLAGFLLRSGEQTGFRVHGAPRTQTSVQAFVSFAGGSTKAKQTETAVLEKAGFVAASEEQLRASHGRQAFSLVMEFTSSASARAAVAYLIKSAAQGQKAKGTKIATYRVKGVPSARGVTAVNRTVSTANNYWTEGRCAFGSGDYITKRTDPLSGPVISGVQALYRRTKGVCP